ncbi:hypothetical protein AAZX31_02G292600 [Glycine max]|nr:hypothetical protein JHK86_005907 [Glycine max]KAH1062994.1 hypothetical protein GYH30_005775 [Glycine max]KAH1263967.1 Protein NLP2 [Glycine max]KAH1263968.1 Protein NLP2 [Glycine max]
MEYGAFGSLSECEEDLIEELLEKGCWVETNGSSEAQYDIEQELAMPMGKTTWWIGPKGPVSGSSSSVKERLVVAVGYLREYTKNNNAANVLIQIWVPIRRMTGLLAIGLGPDESVSVAFPFPTNMNMNMKSNVNIRFFRSHEYPRIPYEYGSLALPVFERGSGTCLGVLQIVMPAARWDTINYLPQLDNNNNNNAFQGMIPGGVVKVFDEDEVYEASVNEMMEVVRCVCKTQNVPLALTWAPCVQQLCVDCGHSRDENNYVSIVDRACFVGDGQPQLLGFQEACSQHHLFRGQGIVGTAFTTAKPCFAMDITAFTKAEYPLSHHANIFDLHSAVAIPLRTSSYPHFDFVLEFFLPKHCPDHNLFLNSLSILLQQACPTFHLSAPIHDDVFTSLPSESQSQQASWIAHMIDAQSQHKDNGKGVCLSLDFLEEEPKEEFKVTTTHCNWDTTATSTYHSHDHVVFSDFGEESQSQSQSQTHTFGVKRGRKPGEKRRTKAEKTISLPVLRQYFAGSLKDAAKSIGVCPTTLKRICRQHGITRWPSRKIKKVGHSLKKLQLVIDSVQGAEGAIQIGSFYNSFPELSSRASQSSSPAAQSPPHVPQQPLRVKATFADEKIRFSLQPLWGFTELQLEISRRFNLSDVSNANNVVLKYLDDDGEWVVLACDGDLEECKDLHTTSQSRTIRLALFQASPLNNQPNSYTFANTTSTPSS